MKRPGYILYYLICLLVIIEGKVFSQVAPSATASAHIYAGIITIFSAGEKTQLNFGRFYPGPQGGQIILSPENTISVHGNGFRKTGSHNAASFYLTGEADVAYTISLPKGPVVLTHSKKGSTMTVDGWVSTPSPGQGTGMLQEGGQVVYVGATLKVGSLNDNPVGIYTGSYAITFDFN